MVLPTVPQAVPMGPQFLRKQRNVSLRVGSLQHLLQVGRQLGHRPRDTAEAGRRRMHGQGESRARRTASM
jgi:hypothetical protein